MMAWLAMGGHAPFIWGAYAVALVVLGGLGLLSWRGHQAAKADVARLEAIARRGRQ
jgi:heme exporter protein CcmD